MDDLKAKLAAQEVELKQKNEDADKLIQARTYITPAPQEKQNKTRTCVLGHISLAVLKEMKYDVK